MLDPVARLEQLLAQRDRDWQAWLEMKRLAGGASHWQDALTALAREIREECAQIAMLVVDGVCTCARCDEARNIAANIRSLSGTAQQVSSGKQIPEQSGARPAVASHQLIEEWEDALRLVARVKGAAQQIAVTDLPEGSAPLSDPAVAVPTSDTPLTRQVLRTIVRHSVGYGEDMHWNYLSMLEHSSRLERAANQMREALLVIPPMRLEFLAEWCDQVDDRREYEGECDVQRDLRELAKQSKAALAAYDALKEGKV